MPRLLLGPPEPPKGNLLPAPTSSPTFHPHVVTPSHLPCLLQPPAWLAGPALPPQGAHHLLGGLLEADPRVSPCPCPP